MPLRILASGKDRPLVQHRIEELNGGHVEVCDSAPRLDPTQFLGTAPDKATRTDSHGHPTNARIVKIRGAYQRANLKREHLRALTQQTSICTTQRRIEAGHLFVHLEMLYYD
jgi:hypothetical protein